MKTLALAGLAIWFLATVALRLAGQWVIRPGSSIEILMLFAVSGVLMYRLPLGLFAALRIAPADYARGAILLVAPGMLLDTISTIWFARVFPNIAPDAAGLFAGWLLFCNVVALISAATAESRRAAAAGTQVAR